MIPTINSQVVNKYIKNLNNSKKNFLEVEYFKNKKNNFKFVLLIIKKNNNHLLKIKKHTSLYYLLYSFKVEYNKKIYIINKKNIGIKFNKETKIKIFPEKEQAAIIKIYEKKSKFNYNL